MTAREKMLDEAARRGRQIGREAAVLEVYAAYGAPGAMRPSIALLQHLLAELEHLANKLGEEGPWAGKR